jgi:hypothetical protein
MTSTIYINLLFSDMLEFKQSFFLKVLNEFTYLSVCTCSVFFSESQRKKTIFFICPERMILKFFMQQEDCKYLT